MKTKVFFSVLFSVLLMAFSPKWSEIDIKVSSQCGECKEILEDGLRFEKGVKRAELTLRTHTLHIVYNPEKTNPETLRKAINNLGYDADSTAADSKAYEALPTCCKKGGH